MPIFNQPSLPLLLFSSLGSGVWIQGLPHAKPILYPELCSQSPNVFRPGVPIPVLCFLVGKQQLWLVLTSVCRQCLLSRTTSPLDIAPIPLRGREAVGPLLHGWQFCFMWNETCLFQEPLGQESIASHALLHIMGMFSGHPLGR